MAISAANLGRVSLNMQMSLLQSGIQGSQVQLLKEQEHLSTGLRIIRPSDDPVGAVAVNRMEAALETQNQYLANINYATKVMNIADSTIGSISNLLRDAHDLALNNRGTMAKEEDRAAASAMIDSIINQIVTLGNTEYLGSYIFAGQANTSAPFAVDENRVKFTGDQNSISVQISQNIIEDLSLVASDVFGTGLGYVEGYRDLAPAAGNNTRLSDINGTLGQGIRLSNLTVTGSVAGQFDIDLTGCKSLGDILEKANSELPAAMSLGLSADGRHLQLTSANPGETLSITESGHGMIAHDLGLYTPVAAAGPITGADFGPELTLQTNVANLNGGAGIDLAGGIVITNGNKSATLDFSTAKTLQDILNTINTSGMDVQARINEQGTGIDIINQVAGSRLTIGENGGTTADDLGIRTLRGDTKLSDLNEGLGVNPLDGADFRITASDGSTVDIDASGAQTIQDIIDRINTEATANGVNLTASIASTGNGIVLTDNTGGANNFTVERQNLSNVAEELGILQDVPAGSQIVGSDTNPTKEESIFTYLLDLLDALKTNDNQGIQKASEAIESFQNRLYEYQGKLGYMARGMDMNKTRTEDAVLTTKTLVSDIKDVDYTEALIRFQTLQTALEANLQSSNKILQTSLLDYLQ
jgi:flagellin-like hook-associated protein FlgL